MSVLENTRNRPPYIPSEWEEVNCVFCGSSNKTLYEKYGDRLQYTHTKCLDCGLIYQSPRPVFNDEFLEAAYGRYFMFNPDYEYDSGKYNSFSDELDEIVRFDPSADSILDVGSAMGDFLNAAKAYYKNVSGVEISKEMALFSSNKLGVDVAVEKFEHLQGSKMYSCIHMSHVIEHIPNPQDWLVKAKELLKDDGVLLIAVPNMYSLTRRFKVFLKRIGLRKGAWKESWRTPDHLFEPTLKSIKQFLSDNGFELLSCYTYSRKDMIAKSFSGKLLNRKLKIGSNIRLYAVPSK